MPEYNNSDGYKHGGRETGGDQPYTYHYNKEERLSLSDTLSKTPKRGGIFRGNRGLIILLIDVAIIALVAVIMLQIFPKDNQNTIKIGGYQFETKVLVSEDGILYIHTNISAQNAEKAASYADEIVKIQYSLGENSASTRITDILPAKNEERTLRTSLEYSSPLGETLYLSISGPHWSGSAKVALSSP